MKKIISAILIFGLVAFAVAGEGQEKEMKKEMAKEDYVNVLMKTSMGNIVIQLDRGKAPVTVENFLNYAKKGAYDGTIFHRVIDGFMIQGGGFNPDMTKRPTDEPIVNEWQNGLSNKRGSIAMARLGGQANSATNQFFINHKDNSFLDQPRDGAGYAVFGQVTEGMGVVDEIAKVAVGEKNMHKDVPVKPVLIEKVTIMSDTGDEMLDKDQEDSGEDAE